MIGDSLMYRKTSFSYVSFQSFPAVAAKYLKRMKYLYLLIEIRKKHHNGFECFVY